MRRNFETTIILLLLISTILLSIVSLATPFKVSGHELDLENNRINVFFNKPISRDIDLSQFITSTPLNDMQFQNYGNRIEILLSNLDLGERYEVKIDKTLSNIFNESLPEERIIKFSSADPIFAYLKTKDNSYSINVHNLRKQTDEVIYETSNEIKSYSIKEKYALVAEAEDKVNIKISFIEVATKSIIKEFRLKDMNLFKVELSNDESFFIYLSQPAKLESTFVIPLGPSSITIVQSSDFNTSNYEYSAFTDDVLDAYITPDNEGLLLRGYDSTFYIKSLTGTEEPITLAKFIGTGGFNSKGSQIIFSAFDPSFAFASFPYISIYNSDRTTEDIKIEQSYILDPVFGKDNTIYYAKRLKEFVGTPGFFGIFKYENNNEVQVIQQSDSNKSLELPLLSSDDNYMCYEVYEETSMLDYTNQRNFINQRKPKKASLNVHEFSRNGDVIEIADAYDCRWI
jgi:hypothetical protein